MYLFGLLGRTAGYNLLPVQNSRIQRAGTGGSLSPISRVGDHWAIEVDTGTLATSCGRALLAKIARGSGGRLRVPIPQKGINLGHRGDAVPEPHSDGAFFSDGTGYSLGMPRVKGDDQSGSSLLVSAFAGETMAEGRFLTIETATGATAHIVTAPAEADSDGNLLIPIWPMMWRAPADGDRVEVVEPYIEGYIVESGGQAFQLFAAVRTDAFMVEEG